MDNLPDHLCAEQAQMIWLRIAIELCRLQNDIRAELVHGPLSGKKVN